MLRQHSYTRGNVVVTDLRDVDPIHSGNRFLVYALFPEQKHVYLDRQRAGNQNCVFACGHSIVNRTSQTHIGALMRDHNGGGHEAAGTCQVPHETSRSPRCKTCWTLCATTSRRKLVAA